MPNECHAHKLAFLCCVLSGLTASWCNLTQLTCACGRPACRTGWSPGLGSKLTGLITGLGFPVWKTHSENDWEDFLVVCCSATTADHIESSILLCLLRYGTASLSSSAKFSGFFSSFRLIGFSLEQRFSCDFLIFGPRQLLWCLCGVVLAVQNS